MLIVLYKKKEIFTYKQQLKRFFAYFFFPEDFILSKSSTGILLQHKKQESHGPHHKIINF